MIELNQTVPDFSLPTSGNQTMTLSNYLGKNIVLYFYPKDDTSGCTLEGQDFTRLHSEFTAHNTLIFGVSRESVKSHDKFCAKYGFTFPLISDETQFLCHLFAVMKEKSMYGKKYMGIERSTFIINMEGVLIQSWRNVKVPNHAETVLAFIKNI